jgi:hypothetical protein
LSSPRRRGYHEWHKWEFTAKSNKGNKDIALYYNYGTEEKKFIFKAEVGKMEKFPTIRFIRVIRDKGILSLLLRLI